MGGRGAGVRRELRHGEAWHDLGYMEELGEEALDGWLSLA